MTRKLIAFLILVIVSFQAQAGVFICSKVYPPIVSEDKVFKAAKKRTYYPISRRDVVQAYSAMPVVITDAILTVVMMPIDSDNTREAYNQLGLGSEVLLNVSDYMKLINLGFIMVYDEYQLIETVSRNAPAVGYTTLYPGPYGPQPCF